MEYVGEIVCTMMGLTESKYQYVIDSMDENDWRRARENEKRRNNDAIIQDAAQMGGVVWCGVVWCGVW